MERQPDSKANSRHVQILFESVSMLVKDFNIHVIGILL